MLLLRSEKTARVGTADYAALRHAGLRHAITRLALAGALVAVLAAAFFAARDLDPQPSGFLPYGTTGVVVLDLSESITSSIYFRLREVLDDVGEARETIGLIVFSDVAYELLPPGTPSEHLQPLLRFFTPIAGSGFDARFPANPWAQGSFGAGTRGSSGLQLASEVLARDNVENGSILFVSDLDVADIGAVTHVIDDLERRGVDVRVVPLFPNEENGALWERLVGADAFIDPSRLPDASGRRPQVTEATSSPRALVILAGLLLLLVAVNERWCARLGPLVRMRSEARA